MSVTCDSAMANMGGGIAAALHAVDCMSTQVTAETFGRLFAPGGSLGTVLTILLTLYVAFFAIGLLLGRSNLDVRALTPRMITLGLVLTFATSWVAYQSVVWNLAIGTPDWLATLLLGGEGSATQNFAAKLDVVFMAVQETSGSNQDFSAFSPEGMMWIGALLLLLGTVGLLVTARIGLALLVALGPIFVVMALFNGTRGLFVGWLKGVVMLSLTPLFAVLGGSIMLELSVPILSALTAEPGIVDPQAAMAFFLIGAVHCALMLMVLKVTSTMVSGWQVFGFAPTEKEASISGQHGPRQVQPYATQQPSNRAAAAKSGPRRIDVSTMSAGSAANDSGTGGTTNRTTRVYATSSQTVASGSLSVAGSRTRGIGNRFRTATRSPFATKPERAS